MTAANFKWTTRNPDGTIRWSWHIIENYLVCPRKYKLSIIDDLVTTKYRQPLALGSCVHAGLAAAYRRLAQAQARRIQAGKSPHMDVNKLPGAIEALAKAAQAAINADGGVTEEDRWEAERIVLAYIHGNDDIVGGRVHFCHWRPVVIEETIYATLGDLVGNPKMIPWSQTPDLIVEVGGSAPEQYHGLWVADHKTTSRLSRDSIAKYFIDGQALALAATAKAAGYPVRGFIPNLIVKTKTIQFADQYIDFSDDVIAEFIESIDSWQKTIRSKISHNGPWQRNYHSCLGQYGYCDYYLLCSDPDAIAGYGKREEVIIERVADEVNLPVEVDYTGIDKA